jgi:uracil-DNA glycosylase family 4
VLIVGLAPAAHGANRTGRVFTGDGSGDFLMRALHANGFANLPTSRHAGDGLELRDAYILAVVRCAPPDNKPAPTEIARCRVHLRAELSALPRVAVVVALGRIAWDGFLAYRREEDTPRQSMAAISAAKVSTKLAATKVATQVAVSTPRAPKPAFGHGVVYPLGAAMPTLLGSYHPSRQNTNTGRLTPGMLDDIFARARHLALQTA